MKIIDSYRDSTPTEIAKMFNKTLNAVNVGISRMVKEHPNYKTKLNRRVLITAEGVEWLANNYFKLYTEVTLPDLEKEKLKADIQRLEELLEQVKEHFKEFSKLSQITLEEKTKQYQIELKGYEEELKKTQDQLHFKEQELKTSKEELNKFQKKKFLGIEYYIKEK